MFGTIFRMRPKAGQEQAIISLFEEWERERRPKVKGAGAGYLVKPEKSPGELIGIAAFSDRESYLANANDPEQHQWYLKLRELLEADPAWEDGEFLAI